MDDMLASDLTRKLDALSAHLRSLAPVALGFSGGVDSTFLAAVCERAIPDGALLVHLVLPFATSPERAALATLRRHIALPLIEIDVDPLSDPHVVRNDADRCYWCKRAGFGRIIDAARAWGAQTVLDGSNADDANDHRPGMRAIHELEVRSPLLETGWRKDEERACLRAWGFETWNMPSGACLATRIPCGTALTADALETVRTCEDYLHDRGLTQVRARLANGVVTIEAAPQDLAALAAAGTSPADDGTVTLSANVRAELARRAACPVARRARPYRSGSMNAPAAS